jgi:predicted heme/steroid binding protein
MPHFSLKNAPKTTIVLLLKIIFQLLELKEINKRALSLRNGTDKPEIWVAFNGMVYDVSNSRLWKNGKHYEHWAGQDLTAELKDAPHTETVFDKMKIIGKLID